MVSETNENTSGTSLDEMLTNIENAKIISAEIGTKISANSYKINF